MSIPISKMPNEMVLLDAERLMKQLDDSTRNVDTTTNPDVFFSRYEFMTKVLTELSDLEERINFTGKPSDALKQAKDPKYYEDRISDFIARSYKRLKNDISKLKTKKAKNNRAAAYFWEMEKHIDQFSEFNIALLNDAKQKITAHIF